jgi:predicted AlkP superfamily phosphohydrolase/phosphomutase
VSSHSCGADRVLVIGIDSATFDLITPWIDEGKLPNLARLVSEGAAGELESVPNRNSAPSWSSIVTGKNPGKHGIFYFVEDNPEQYAYQYINASFRAAKPIWQILSEAGKRVGVMNVPISYPAEPLNGFMLAGIDAPGTYAPNFSYPPDLFRNLYATLGEYIIEPGLPSLIKAAKRDEAVRTLYKTVSQRLHYARHLMSEQPWDLFFVVFTSLDTAQHFFWKYMQPEHFDVSLQERERFGKVILNVHQMLDDAVGQLTELAGPGTHVIVVSDHGMGATDSRNMLLPYWLQSLGLLAFEDGERQGSAVSPRHMRREVLDLLAYLYRQVDRRLDRNAKLRLARMLPRLRAVTEVYMKTGRFDWSHTKAYADGNRDEIWINLKGRQRQGIVEPGLEYDELCSSIDEHLCTAHDPITGEPYVDQVYRREEVYSGPLVHRSPDLIIRWHRGGWIDNMRFGNRSGAEVKRAAARYDPIVELGSGHHTDHGILILWGDGIQPTSRPEGACVYDVTPTILYLMGLPVPSDMDGRVLTDVLEHELLSSRPVETTPAEETGAEGERLAYTQEDEGIIAERLRGLGYVD